MGKITAPPNAIAFPRLTAADMALLKPMATTSSFRNGETIYQAGDADVDLFVVESGEVAVLNPADGEVIVSHGPGQFSGDIDLLTRRPVIVTGVARGQTQLLRISGERLREVLNKLPHFAEVMLGAIQERRRLLAEAGVFGLKVVGPGKCRDTTLVREFLYKNFVPFVWYDSASGKGQQLMAAWGSPQKTPVIEFMDGRRLTNPGLRELAQNAGIWRHCPPGPVDLAIIGAGPAGMAAAVYAASEGVSTVVLDSVGPGGKRARLPRSKTLWVCQAGPPVPTWQRAALFKCSSLERAWWRRCWLKKSGAARQRKMVMCFISIVGQNFAAALCRSQQEYVGESWKLKEQAVLNPPESTMRARRLSRFSTTSPMSVLWEEEILPARLRSSSQTAAVLEPFTCWFEAVSDPRCPSTWLTGFVEQRTLPCMKAPK